MGRGRSRKGRVPCAGKSRCCGAVRRAPGAVGVASGPVQVRKHTAILFCCVRRAAQGRVECEWVVNGAARAGPGSREFSRYLDLSNNFWHRLRIFARRFQKYPLPSRVCPYLFGHFLILSFFHVFRFSAYPALVQGTFFGPTVCSFLFGCKKVSDMRSVAQKRSACPEARMGSRGQLPSK